MTAPAWKPSTPTVLLGVFAALVVILVAPVQAQAAFSSTLSQSISVSSATLQPPTAVTLTKSCGSILADPATMTAAWTATTSTFATGYVITPYLNGTAQTTVAVNGRTTTTAVLPITRNTLTATNTWTFTIYAKYNNWTTNAVSPTPASVSCVALSL